MVNHIKVYHLYEVEKFVLSFKLSGIVDHKKLYFYSKNSDFVNEVRTKAKFVHAKTLSYEFEYDGFLIWATFSDFNKLWQIGIEADYNEKDDY